MASNRLQLQLHPTLELERLRGDANQKQKLPSFARGATASVVEAMPLLHFVALLNKIYSDEVGQHLSGEELAI